MELSDKTLQELKRMAEPFSAGSIAVEFNEAEGKEDVVVLMGRKRVVPRKKCVDTPKPLNENRE